LMNGFRRYLHLLVPLRHLRRPWCQRRGGVTPGPKGDEGQKQCACQLRRAFDKAGAPRGGCDVVCSKAVCSHGYRTACTGSHGSLPGRV
jgi:hypothetical protein